MQLLIKMFTDGLMFGNFKIMRFVFYRLIFTMYLTLTLDISNSNNILIILIRLNYEIHTIHDIERNFRKKGNAFDLEIIHLQIFTGVENG